VPYDAELAAGSGVAKEDRVFIENIELLTI
jgi:hypothetical protein